MFSCQNTSKSTNNNSDSTLQNAAQVEITPGSDMEGKRPFPFIGKHEMKLTEIAIYSGSFSGLEIRFDKKLNDSTHLMLKMTLPSTENFFVYQTGSGITYKCPPLPFSLTHLDFEGITDALYEDPVHAVISASTEIRDKDNLLKTESIASWKFNLEFEEFRFDDRKAFIIFNFDAEIDEVYTTIYGLYKIKAQININGAECGGIMVD